MLKILIQGLVLLTLEPTGAPSELWVLFANAPRQICEQAPAGHICTVPSRHLAKLNYVDKGGAAKEVDLTGKHVELVGRIKTPLATLMTAMAPGETPNPGNQQDFRWVLSMKETQQLPYPRALKPQLLTTPYLGGSLLSARLRLAGGTIRTEAFETSFGNPRVYVLDGGRKKAVAKSVAVELEIDDPKLEITSLLYRHPALEKEELRAQFSESNRFQYILGKAGIKKVIDLEGVRELTFSNHPEDPQDNSPHFLAFYHLFYPEVTAPLKRYAPVGFPDGTGLCGPLTQP